MKCIRVAMEADVRKYETGQNMEDGFELWTDVVTEGWIVTDSLIRIQRENGTVVCPFITTRRGKTFICEGDYIIQDSDGTKHVCGADKVFTRYQKIE